MELDALFFDFDGVIADSVEVKTEAFSNLYEKHGKEVQALVMEHHRKNGGMTRRDKFKVYHGEYLKQPLDKNGLDQLCHEFSGLAVKKVIESPEISGAEDFLKKMHKKVYCFVVSATPDEEIEMIVKSRGLEKYFTDVLGSSNSKTKNVTALLEKYHINPDKCFFFGDAESDCIASKNCNIPFIGILPGTDAPLLTTWPDIKWYRNFTDLQKEGFYGY